MTITDIQKTKKGRFSIFADGEFLFSIHADIFASSPISIGRNMEPDELESYRTASESRITRERALRLLSARSYTKKGLYDKLRVYADEESAAAAVERMAELGLVNDADYARRYAADCMNLKGYSLSRTALALREKGISREIIEDTLSELDFDPELAIAEIITKKYARYLDDDKGIAKTTNALLRLGYRHGDIRRVMANLAEDAGYYDY